MRNMMKRHAIEATRAARLGLIVSLAAALAGCVVAPPPGPILSRLAPDQPGAAAPARPLTAEEKKRYDEIDRQVLREQNEAQSERARVRYYTPYYSTPYYSPPIVYGGYSRGYYNGWGVGVGSGYGWWW
jgi:hypothetical protein